MLPFGIWSNIPKDEQPKPKEKEKDIHIAARRERDLHPERDISVYLMGKEIHSEFYREQYLCIIS